MMSRLALPLSVLLASTTLGMENEFDTYNADKCQRVRRSWTSLSDDDKAQYIHGLLQLRSHDGIDDFVTIIQEHLTNTGVNDHKDSNWFFWHAYLLWEVESRIRNLGGEFACFAMPYWDYTTERMPELRPVGAPALIYDDFVGGEGDPDDEYKINGYSWDVATEDWWVPSSEYCGSSGDEFPVCSLKRYFADDSIETIPNVFDNGRAIRELSDFIDFSKWYIEDSSDAKYGNADYPGNLGSVSKDVSVMTIAYDPIWLLFHSFVQYQQFMWVDCNDYDLIDPSELDAHPEAYTAYCDESEEACAAKGMQLDDAFEYPLDKLRDAEWSVVHREAVTVRKAYHAPRWNILYDLGGGDGFFSNAGLDEWCGDRLNPEWFRLERDEQGRGEGQLSVAMRSVYLVDAQGAWLPLAYMAVAAVVMVVALVVQRWRRSGKAGYLAI